MGYRIRPLAAALARQGHAVDIYRVRTGPGQASCEDVQAGVRIHRVGLQAPWPLEHHGRLSQTVMASVLNTYCTGSNLCYVYVYSNGGAVMF